MPPSFSVGELPNSVAVADLNGDVSLDLAVANSGSDNVSVLLGNGDGTFVPGGSLAVGEEPVSVATADLDGDGEPDLVVVNQASGDVSVLLGDGNGNFVEPNGSPFGVGNNPSSVAIGSLDGDGTPDLAVTNNDDDNVTVLLGDGDGTFSESTGSPFGVGTGPWSVAIADVDNASRDLVVANFDSDNVSVLLGDGSGGAFSDTPDSPFAVGDAPFWIAVGDLDMDNDIDIVTANAGSDNVSVLLGDGAGDFTGSPFATGSVPSFVTIADLDEDAIPDLAVANFSSNNVSVLLGKGDGTFEEAVRSPFRTGRRPVAVAIGDFDGNGQPDLAVANSLDDNVAVLLNPPL